MAPVGAGRRLQVALQVAHEAGERVLDEVAVVHARGAARALVARAGAPDVDQRVPLDDLEVDLDADLGEVLLQNSFIGSGCIWPEPEGEIRIFVVSGFCRAVAGLGQQALRLRGSCFSLKDGLPNQGGPAA
jgi:hypothetical protein